MPGERKLTEVATKVADWFEKQASRHIASAENCRFGSLRYAYLADAKNYRAMAADLRAALAEAVRHDG